ncbi:LAGLIDADG family homing endonuclease [Nocardia sp. NPDC058705]|uniref:LAGLIDADG family homing endonuclease n=1 Tax=Nocardia sp. NPDC058705 TaxID=3346609 RepID=UPI003693DDD8
MRKLAARDASPGSDETIACFAGETSVLTEQGDRPIIRLAGGVHTLLTEGGKWVKAPVDSFGYQQLWHVTVGRYGQERTIRTTAGHRWLLRPKVAHNRTEATTSSLRVGDRLAYSYPERIAQLHPSRVGVAQGFVFGDGSISGNALAHANFFGSKDRAMLPYYDNIDRLRTYYYHYDAATKVRRHVKAEDVPTVREQGETVHAMRRLGGLPREWKRKFPARQVSDADLYGWLAGYFAADGEVGKTGRPAIWSADRKNLEFFKSACTRLGIYTLPIRRKVHAGFQRETPADGAEAEIFVMGIARSDLSPEFFVHAEHRRRWAANNQAVERRGWTVRSFRQTTEVEEVFCAVVADTNSFCLSENILTGSCSQRRADLVDATSGAV